MFFCDLCVLARKLASPFGHLTQLSRQIQVVATCDYMRVRLTRALVRPSRDLGHSTRKKKVRVDYEPRSARGRAVN